MSRRSACALETMTDRDEYLLQTATDRFERRLAAENGKLRVEVATGFGQLRAEMIDRNQELLKWMLVFLAMQLAATAALLALFH